ncbi:MAG: hypothetical protein Q9208_004009 [Pyrenodesmia sp. 3 TL-2023]
MTRAPALCPGVHELHYDITNVASFEPVEEWTRFWPTLNTPDPNSILEVSRLLRIPNEVFSGRGPGGEPSIAKVRKAISELQSHTGLPPPECLIRVCRAYQAVSTDQERMRRRENREEEFAAIVNAFERMPNLKAVTLGITPLYTAGLEYSDASDDEVMWTFAHHVATTFKGADPPGVLELMMVLRASAEAGRPLHHLRCHYLNWRFFPRPDKEFSDIEGALSRLQSLFLSIDVQRYDELGGVGGIEEGDEATKGAVEGGVFKFLSSAPCLKELIIKWSAFTEPDLDLRRVFGSYTWAFLESIHLWRFECRDSDLRAFLKRHAGTLASVCLSMIRNTDGLWAPTFLFMRLELNLVSFQGDDLYGTDEENWWLGDDDASRAEGDDNMADIINEYVTGTGPAPLLHPKQKRHGEYLVDDGNGGLTVLTA